MFCFMRLVAAVVVMVLVTDAVGAQEKKLGSATIQLLQEKIDMKDLQQPTTLKEFLVNLMGQFEEKKKELVVLVDQNAFKEENPDVPDIYDSQIKFPAHLKTLPAATALRIALSQIPTNNATYLARQGYIDITTIQRSQPGRLLQETIATTFRNTPLDEALETLSEQTGATIVIDQRVKDQIRMPVSAAFRNTITLETAVRRLAEMVELAAVVEDDILWIRNKPAKEKAADTSRLEFKNRRLDSALAELAERTKTTIVLDPLLVQAIRDTMQPFGRRFVAEEAAPRSNAPNPFLVTATFQGKYSAEHAARVLAHMAGYGVNMVGDVIYVTPNAGLVP
ncbi:MAG: hypothetical protein L0215_14965 [Gemmataceae bacterium]|nr:hypothetical protein [Gemmataceae bacterium]